MWSLHTSWVQITSLSKLVRYFSSRKPQNKNFHRSEKHNFFTWGWKIIFRVPLYIHHRYVIVSVLKFLIFPFLHMFHSFVILLLFALHFSSVPTMFQLFSFTLFFALLFIFPLCKIALSLLPFSFHLPVKFPHYSIIIKYLILFHLILIFPVPIPFRILFYLSTVFFHSPSSYL